MDKMPNPTILTKRATRMALVSMGLGLVGGSLFLVNGVVLAQGGNLGLNQFAANTNLGTNIELIGLVARIINIALGFLGVIAIGLIIYAGWLWLTARGEATKIDKAKKIMTGAVIGLAIILSAYAIASFIIRQIQNSTTGGGGVITCWDGTTIPPATTCPPPPLPGDYLQVRSQFPMGNGIKLCEAVQVGFSEAVRGESVTVGTFMIEDITDPNSPVPFTSGEYRCGASTCALNQNSINVSFVQTAGSDYEPNTPYRVTLKSGFTGLRGVSNTSLQADKVWTFTTGTESDNTRPTIQDTYPATGELEVCLAAPIQITFSEPMLASSFVVSNPPNASTDTVILRELNNPSVMIPLSEPILGNVYQIVTLNPLERLHPYTEYEVFVRGGTGGVADTCGNTMANDYTWNFTTGETIDCTPSITSVVPDERDYGQESTITGTNLFNDGFVFVNNYPFDANSFDNQENILCWNGTPRFDPPDPLYRTCDAGRAIVRAPVGATTGPAYDQGGFTATAGQLHINVGATNSNALPYTITSPHIAWLSPNSGGIGQFVTIGGWNFGDQSGEVRFYRTNGTYVVAEPPASCSDWWNETAIVVKVPEGLMAGVYYQVEVRTAAGGSNPNKRSNSQSFQVTNQPPGPGICEIVPNSSPINALPIDNFTVNGERFGDSQGTSVLTFNSADPLMNATPSVWSEGQIIARTPSYGDPLDPQNLLGSGSWPVQVKVNNVLSNALTFVVGPDTNLYPQVVDYAGCGDGSQSPSPYRNTTDACGNAVLSARFTMPMDPATLTIGDAGNINVTRCGAGSTFDPNDCSLSVGFGTVNYLRDSNNEVIGFSSLPQGGFANGYWYRAIITTGVTSALGNAMRAPYEWHFKIASNLCPLSSVALDSPYGIINSLTPPDNTHDFSVLANAANCNAIDPSIYHWRWASANHPSTPPPDRISLYTGGNSYTDGLTQMTVVANDWTEPNKPSSLTVEAIGENKSATGSVYVSSTFCNQSTDCDACGTGLSSCVANVCTPVIGNRNSANPDGLSPDDGAPGTWLTISGCYFGSERGRVEYGDNLGLWPDPAICGPSTWSNTQIISEVPNSSVGPVGVKITRTDGSDAIGPSPFNINTLNRPGLCRLAPTYSYETTLGTPAATITYDGHGFGGGQDVTMAKPSWWQNLTVIVRRARAQNITFDSTRDKVNYYFAGLFTGSAGTYPSWSDNRIQAITPAPPAVTVNGQRPNQVTINKNAIESNSLNYFVLPGGGGGVGQSCDLDPNTEMCEVNATFCQSGLACNPNVGCTCQPIGGTGTLPRITGITPPDNATNVCRNTTVTITFDQNVSSNTIQNGQLIVRTSGGCQEQVISKGGWRGWLARLFKLVRPVQADAARCVAPGYLTVSGNSITFTPTEALAPNSLYTITVNSPLVDCANSNYSGGNYCTDVNFTTSPDICQVHSVSIDPLSHVFTEPNTSQSFTAQAHSIDGQNLAATYAWDEDDSANVVQITSAANQPTVTFGNYNRNGEATAIVTATGSLLNSGQATARASLRVFICEEPWIVSDTDYDFELKYCRGETGDPDLLPELLQTSVNRNPSVSNGLMREYFFKHPESNEVIGLRIYQNFDHLSPMQWYLTRGDINRGAPSPITVDDYEAVRDLQTVYVGAVARRGSDLYTNIYVLSYSQNASAETLTIFDDMLLNWTFNPSLVASSQAQLQRDLRRLQDIAYIGSKLFDYYSANGNKYPTLPAGTFLAGKSTSTWSSWQAELANALGSALPVDPINKFVNCPAGYDPKTCWQARTKSFVCPAGSHVYQYTVGNGAASFTLNANLEYKQVTWKGASAADDIIIDNSDECNSYTYSGSSGGSVSLSLFGEDKKAPARVTLNVFGSPTRHELTISWTESADGGGSGLSHYELWRTPDRPGFSPDPNSWQKLGGAIFVRSATDNPPGDGGYWYGVHAVDKAGNSAPEVQPVMGIKDTTAPKDPVCTPAGGTYNSPQQVSCTASDQGVFKTGVEVHYTSGAVTPSCGSPIFNNPTAVNSSISLNMITCDAAGNASSIVRHSYTINTVTPTATITMQAQDNLGNQLTGVVARLDGAAVGVTPITSSASYGTHTASFDEALACYKYVSISPVQPMNITDNLTVTGVYDAVPPGTVASPSPADGLNNVSINTALDWSVAACSTEYDVYLGTNQLAVQNATPASAEFIVSTSSSSYTVSGLNYATTYYWRVDARNQVGVTKGKVWSFTTEAEPTAIITFKAITNRNDALTGAYVRLNDVLVGVTPTSINTAYGLYTVSFYDNVACYTYESMSPSQPMNVNDNVTVTATFSQDLPLAAINPSPDSGAINMPLSTSDLKWGSGGCTAAYDLYFGTSQSAVQNATITSPEYKGNVTNAVWPLPSLNSATTYYWRVDARNQVGVTKGKVWSFTTAVSNFNVTFESRDDNNTLVSGATFAVDSGPADVTTKIISLPQGSHTVIYQNNLSCHSFSGSVTPSTTFTVTGNMTVTGYYKRSSPGVVAAPQEPVNGASGVKLDSTLIWQMAACASSYDVYLGTNQLAVQNATVTSPEYQGNEVGNSFKPSALNYSVTYYWRVDARNAVGTTKGAVWSFTTEAPPTATITFQSQDDLGKPLAGATVRWDGLVIGTTPTSITDSLGSHTASFDNSISCYKFASLSPVQPMNVTGGATVTATFKAIPPSQTVALNPLSGATEVTLSPTLSWTAADCATSYDVYLGTNQLAVQNATVTSPEYKLNTTGLSYSASGLAYATVYYWRIDARSSTSITKGTVWSFTTQAAPSATVTMLARDSWGAGLAGAIARLDGVVIGTTPTSASGVVYGSHVVSFDNTLPCYIYTGIAPAQPMDVTGNVTVIGTYSLLPPGQVTNPSPADKITASTSPILTWTAGPCSASFDVYLGTDENAVQNATTASSEFKLNTTVSSYSAGKLSHATTYYWRVDTRNSAGVTKGAVWSFTAFVPILSIEALDDEGNRIHGMPVYLNYTYIGFTYYYMYLQTSVTPGKNIVSFNSSYDCYNFRSMTPNQPMNVTDNTIVTAYFLPSKAPASAAPYRPADGEINVSPTSILNNGISFSIQCGTSSFDIYYGTNASAVENATVSSPEHIGTYKTSKLPGPTFYVPLPNYATTYYWRVDTHNSLGSQKGQVWNFTTTASVY